MARIGTAGWALRAEHAGKFGPGGSHLARYATRFNAVEINSSFYRPHQAKTYQRWANETPRDFAFAVKMPRQITHEKRLVDTSEALTKFFGECCALEEKLGCVLVQLPPSLDFDAKTAEAFFAGLRNEYAGAVALEPRHESWFEDEPDEMLINFRIARVAADPVPARVKSPNAGEPGGFGEQKYWRLHGSPKIYYSAYSADFLSVIADRVGDEDWCIFDNTALGHATENALALTALVQKQKRRDR